MSFESYNISVKEILKYFKSWRDMFIKQKTQSCYVAKFPNACILIACNPNQNKSRLYWRKKQQLCTLTILICHGIPQ